MPGTRGLGNAEVASTQDTPEVCFESTSCFTLSLEAGPAREFLWLNSEFSLPLWSFLCCFSKTDSGPFEGKEALEMVPRRRKKGDVAR